MMKILAAIIAATVCGCGVKADADPVVVECEPLLVLANPGPSAAHGCFRAIAGADSCVRLPGDEACYASVTVRHGENYEAWACSVDWGAPTLEACEPGEVLQ